MTTSTTTTKRGRKGPMLTVRQAAEEMGLTEWWVRRLISSGELRAINVGHHGTHARWRIEREDLEAWIRSRENRARDLVA